MFEPTDAPIPAPPRPAYCDVVVEIARPELARVFTYRVPDGMDARIGARVRVPFGSRRIEGYVLGLRDSTELAAERVKPVDALLDETPALLPELIALARWMEGQYACLPVESLRLLIPAQMREGRIRVKTETVAALAPCLLPLDGILPEDAAGWPDTLIAAVDGLRSRHANRQADALESIAKAGSNPPPRSVFPSSVVSALVSGGFVTLEKREILRAPRVDPIESVPDPPLTADQTRVLSTLREALSAGGAFMLWGVTGSGKTEVFIRLAREALARGQGVIVLVPEIALTPQMTSWFQARFGKRSAVLHSRLSAGERYDEWRRIRRGDARVVIGARSAIFAPVERLGVIIIDEEHENSYVSERHPCYDAREVARERCRAANAVLLLASATPSLPDFSRVLRSQFQLLEMPKRVNDRPMPAVELIDMRQEIAKGNFSVLSNTLAAALVETVNDGKQAMLLMNRRGYSTFVSCRACGYVERCDQCDVSMTYHQADSSLRCHYCGAARIPPARCPACGSSYIKYFGAGTQKVEATVRELLPDTSILRMDSDTSRGKDACIELLRAFREGEARVMIGTQMIAKGLDFPNVTLVGVIAADAMLHLPDYRSAERTFQLVTQAAGRAGRAQSPGRVVVQTYDPSHYSITAACAQDYRSFYEREIDSRRISLYPPFTRMTRILYEGAEPLNVQSACESDHALMLDFLHRNPALRRQVVHMNARPAPIERIKGQTRWQLFLKLYARGPTSDILEQLRTLTVSHQDAETRASLQIDPPNLL
ncbi:MAG: primosomal protein N' [Oscillospiraceae bacterium]|jgi:primosomal protein N' (replication factor Y)|nr:primosomal protein N' [Oscillospiraceae bacterium]